MINSTVTFIIVRTEFFKAQQRAMVLVEVFAGVCAWMISLIVIGTYMPYNVRICHYLAQAQNPNQYPMYGVATFHDNKYSLTRCNHVGNISLQS